METDYFTPGKPGALASIKHSLLEGGDPYLVLGVDEGQSLSDIRTAWKELVRQNHPDQMFARGVPEEAIKLAEKRLVKINRAYEIIREQKSMTSELT